MQKAARPNRALRVSFPTSETGRMSPAANLHQVYLDLLKGDYILYDMLSENHLNSD